MQALVLALAAVLPAPAIEDGAAAPGTTEIAEPSVADTVIYPGEFFDRYSPRTVLDIVARVPGFAIDFGNDRRGFDDTGGNVLVNAARVQSKSGGLREALERIPARSVERIELITNPTMAAASGKTVIANVVLRVAEPAGTWKISTQRARDASVSPWLDASYTAPVGDWQVSVTGEVGAWRDPNAGSRVRRDAGGAATLFEEERRGSVYEKAVLSVEAKRTSADRELVFNARYADDTYDLDVLRRGFASAAFDMPASQIRTVAFVEDGRDAELGVTYRRPLWDDWRLEALTLMRSAEVGELSSSLIEAPANVFSSGARSLARRESGEWISRAVVTAPERAGWRPEFGGELVYNRMDAALDLVTLTAAGIATPVSLPSADVIVDEWRVETFINASRTVLRDWTIDAGVSFELSNIAVRGGAQASQKLAFMKPSIAVAWKPTDKLSLRGTLRREAGQLDFNDFAASAELGADRTFGGNPELRPDTSTRMSLDIDYRPGSDLAINLELFHDWKQDVSEPIVLPSGDFGVGNAGDARVWGASLRASRSLPFSLRADMSASWQDAAFRDNITGVTRPTSGLTPFTFEVRLRQDFPEHGLAWGAHLLKEGVVDDFFVAELQSIDFGYERSIYLEKMLPWEVKATLSVSEPSPRQFALQRTFFAPTRAGLPVGSEVRRWERGPDISLAIERRF